MATNEPPKPPGKGKKRVWWKDPTLLVVGGVGAAAGLLVLMRSRGGGGATDAIGTETAGVSGVPSYSSIGQDMYNAVQDSTETLREQLATLSGDVADVNLRLQQQIPTRPGQPSLPTRRAIWHGTKVTQRQSLYRFAQTHGGTLPEIIAHNPWLKGKKGSYMVRPGQIVRVR